jgi:hypothetical protein
LRVKEDEQYVQKSDLLIQDEGTVRIIAARITAAAAVRCRDSGELNGTTVRASLTSAERGSEDQLVLRLFNKMLTCLIQIC